MIETANTEMSAMIDPDVVKKVADLATEAINIDKDLEEAEKLTKDSFDLKNEAIRNADIPLNEKLALFDENQNKRLEDTKKAMGFIDYCRKNKALRWLGIILTILGAIFTGIGGYQYYQNINADNNSGGSDEDDTNNLAA